MYLLKKLGYTKVTSLENNFPFSENGKLDVPTVILDLFIIATSLINSLIYCYKYCIHFILQYRLKFSYWVLTTHAIMEMVSLTCYTYFLPLCPPTNMPVIHSHHVLGWLFTLYFYKRDSLNDLLVTSVGKWALELQAAPDRFFTACCLLGRQFVSHCYI